MSDPVMTLRFTLPWPPSINSMYSQGIIGGKHKKARASMFLSERGKAYRVEAMVALNQQRVPKGRLQGRLRVEAVAHPPNLATHDLDNLWKSALDVLKHNGVITDDGYIDDLHVTRGPVRGGGVFALAVSEIAEAFESRQQGLDLPQAMPAKPF